VLLTGAFGFIVGLSEGCNYCTQSPAFYQIIPSTRYLPFHSQKMFSAATSGILNLAPLNKRLGAAAHQRAEELHAGATLGGGGHAENRHLRRAWITVCASRWSVRDGIVWDRGLDSGLVSGSELSR
jgi:hypothetical protein